MKTYCAYCRYYKESYNQCLAPQNYIDTYLAPLDKLLYAPCEKNKYNDCNWYEKKQEKDGS